MRVKGGWGRFSTPDLVGPAAPARGTAAFGRLFEEFVVLELMRQLAYRELA
jgi:hypothetical protein